MIFVFKSKTRARSETNNNKKSLDRALDRFPNKNRTVEFRIEARARSETNNYKSLWIALLIVFQNKNRTVEFRIQARARSEANNYKSLWIALLIYFWKQINVLIPCFPSLENVLREYSNIFNSIFILDFIFQEQNTEMIFVFKSKTRARSETNNYKSLWIALLIGFLELDRALDRFHK